MVKKGCVGKDFNTRNYSSSGTSSILKLSFRPHPFTLPQGLLHNQTDFYLQITSVLLHF